MKNIFESLFCGDIAEISRVDKSRRHKQDKESVVYEKLMTTFSEEQKILFEQFIEAKSENEYRKEKDIYGRALKIGLKMGIEAGQYDPYDD